jgi:hypothetical protein
MSSPQQQHQRVSLIPSFSIFSFRADSGLVELFSFLVDLGALVDDDVVVVDVVEGRVFEDDFDREISVSELLLLVLLVVVVEVIFSFREDVDLVELFFSFLEDIGELVDAVVSDVVDVVVVVDFFSFLWDVGESSKSFFSFREDAGLVELFSFLGGEEELVDAIVSEVGDVVVDDNVVVVAVAVVVSVLEFLYELD